MKRDSASLKKTRSGRLSISACSRSRSRASAASACFWAVTSTWNDCQWTGARRLVADQDRLVAEPDDAAVAGDRAVLRRNGSPVASVRATSASTRARSSGWRRSIQWPGLATSSSGRKPRTPSNCGLTKSTPASGPVVAMMAGACSTRAR